MARGDHQGCFELKCRIVAIAWAQDIPVFEAVAEETAADVVRSEIKPLFFVECGHFGLMFGPTVDHLRNTWTVPTLEVDEIEAVMERYRG